MINHEQNWPWSSYPAMVSAVPRATLVKSGLAIGTVWPYSDVSTTMIYTQVLNKGGRGVVSPLDR